MVAEQFGISQGSVQNYSDELVQKLVAKSNDVIRCVLLQFAHVLMVRLPVVRLRRLPSEAELYNSAEKFENRFGVPGAHLFVLLFRFLFICANMRRYRGCV